MDEIHLRRLLDENILRVEKENWDLIYKENQEENIKVPGRILKETQDITDSVVVKSLRKTKNAAIKQKIRPLKFTKPSDATIPPKGEPTKQQASDDGFDKHHIQFLNHYQTHLQQQQWELQKKCLTYAIPLALPSQKDVHFNVEKVQKSKKETNKENNHLYYYAHKEGARKLTIQKLPSITVSNRSSKVNSNILLEEVTEYDEETRHRVKSFNSDPVPCHSFHVSKSASESFLSERNMKLEIRQPEKSVFAEPEKSVFADSIIDSQSSIDRDVLKALVKEILEDSICSSNVELLSEKHNEKGCFSKIKSCQSCSTEPILKKEQNYDCHLYARNTLHTQTEEAAIFNTFSQTDSTTPDKQTMDSSSLKRLIHEVISEYHEFSHPVPDWKNTPRELHAPTDSLKEEKIIQVNIPIFERNPATQLSKETQVSMNKENGSFQSNTHTLKRDNNGYGKMNENKLEKESPSSSIEQQLAAVTSKVENLMNVFNNHVMKNNDFHSEIIPQSKSSNSERPIHTRDVSLQFSPYLVNKSAYTSPVRTLEKANQCTDYLDSNQTKKQYLNVSTQATTSLFDSTVKKHATIATQSECWPASVVDTCVQTVENMTIGHSNNSSVSVTPVSDTQFLDDVLSEGEIPFHLKFLSFHDNAATLNSVAAESSEEKDYSLSEGEIPPQYLRSSYTSSGSANHLNKGVNLCSCASQKHKSSPEKIWSFAHTSLGEAASSFQERNARQINCSTPIWDHESSYLFHSPGEVPPSHCYFSNERTNSNGSRQVKIPTDSMKKADISVMDSNNYHHKTIYQISPSNLSSLSSLENSN